MSSYGRRIRVAIDVCSRDDGRPAIAGLVIGGLGSPCAYTIDVVTYGLALVASRHRNHRRQLRARGRRRGPRDRRAPVPPRALVLMSVFSIRPHRDGLRACPGTVPRSWRTLGGGPGLYGLLLASVAAERFSPRWRARMDRRASRTTGARLICVTVWGATIRRRGAHDRSHARARNVPVRRGADIDLGRLRSDRADVTPDDLRAA